jgi:hypothetical protein
MSNGYNSASPFYNTPINGSYLDVLEFKDIPSVASDIEYEIMAQHAFRPDLLAFDFYGNARLWWVFAVRNKDKIKDPVYDLFAGQKIRIPQIETLRALGL